MIMHHPLLSPHRKGVILGHFQILHHLGARYHPPTLHHAIGPIGPQHMHAQRDPPHRQEALLLRQEGMLFVGVDRLTRLGGGFAMPSGCGRGQGQVHQVIVMVDPDVQDGLLFHLVRLRVVGPHLLAHLQRDDRLLAMIGGNVNSKLKLWKNTCNVRAIIGTLIFYAGSNKLLTSPFSCLFFIGIAKWPSYRTPSTTI